MPSKNKFYKNEIKSQRVFLKISYIFNYNLFLIFNTFQIIMCHYRELFILFIHVLMIFNNLF